MTGDKRAFMKELRRQWAALPEPDRELLDAWIDDANPRQPVSEKRRWIWRSGFFNQAQPVMTAAAWVAEQRAWHEELRRRERARDEERRGRTAERREAYAQKLVEIRAAIARGESVPARYRPVGGRCALCRKPLRDPESVRLGIGPDCRHTLTEVRP